LTGGNEVAPARSRNLTTIAARAIYNHQNFLDIGEMPDESLPHRKAQSLKRKSRNMGAGQLWRKQI